MWSKIISKEKGHFFYHLKDVLYKEASHLVWNQKRQHFWLYGTPALIHMFTLHVNQVTQWLNFSAKCKTWVQSWEIQVASSRLTQPSMFLRSVKGVLTSGVVGFLHNSMGWVSFLHNSVVNCPESIENNNNKQTKNLKEEKCSLSFLVQVSPILNVSVGLSTSSLIA